MVSEKEVYLFAHHGPTIHFKRIAVEANTVRRNLWLSLILSSGALIVGVVSLVIVLGAEKIAVVRTADLVSEYRGMDDARAVYERRKQEWQREIDTLESDYRASVNALNKEWSQLGPAEQEKRRNLVHVQEQNLMQYAQSLDRKIREEEDRLMEGVLAQVNDAVREYAEKYGYDVIYGATPEGSILHGDAQVDITEDLLEALNGSSPNASKTAVQK